MRFTVLWLDDIRDPLRNDRVIFDSTVEKNITWVKNYDEFVSYIEENGLPWLIQFDHDLAEEHYCPPDEYESFEAWENAQKFSAKTGLDCAKWLVDYCRKFNVALPLWSCHSQNPVGKQRIQQELKKYEEDFNGEND